MHVCLNMIVKNESAIIDRCLESVLGFISSFVIHDTGSTDGTADQIRNFFAEHKIPGRVLHKDFVNFEVNRNAALCDAFRTPGVDMVLLLDADMRLVVGAPMAKVHAALDAKKNYHLTQKCGRLSYCNTRLLGQQAYQPGVTRYVEPTHEYVSCCPSPERVDIGLVYIDDVGDGGCKADKFERDRRLLEQGVKDEPTNPRRWFYLAQTYHCLSMNREAADTYRRYLQNPGFEEEAWYAQFMIGKCLAAIKEYGEAAWELLKAHQRRPHRVESLFKLFEMLKEQDMKHAAWDIGERGLMIRDAKDDSLFVDQRCFETTFLSEMLILAYYVNQKERGRQIADELLLSPFSLSNLSNVRSNAIFYITPLAGSRTELILPPELDSKEWACANPSLCVLDKTVHLNVRCVNYKADSSGSYTRLLDGVTFCSERPVVTQNARGEWRDDSVRNLHVVADDCPLEDHKGWIKGFEDVRLFVFRQQLWFSTTCRDRNPNDRNEMIISNGERWLRLAPRQHCEKNWLFWEHKGDLLSIYSYDPFVVLRIDPETGDYTELVRRQYKLPLSDFRGSANPVRDPRGGGYFLLIHEVWHGLHSASRHYVHRFLYLNDDLFITKISGVIRFQDKTPIDYAAGMAIVGEDVLVTYGIHDRKAELVSFPLATLRAMLGQD